MITPSQLKTARNQLRGPRSRRQLVGSAFVGPLLPNQSRARGQRRAVADPRRAANVLTFSERRIEAPVASSSVMRSNTSSSAAPFPLRRKEYIGDIPGSVAFAATKFSVNPGLSQTYPWGSGIAPSFEEYESMLVAFHYEPEQSSSATGTVILVFDYDAADPTPTDKATALTYSDNVRSAPWVPCTLVLKVSDLRKRGRLFTRTGAVANTDIKTYDLGNVYVCTQGQANSNTVGEFWISYHHPLHTPQKSLSIFSQNATIVTSAISKATYFTGGTIAGSLPVTATGMTVTFPIPGQWILVLGLAGTGLAQPSVGAGTSTAVVTLGFNGAAGTTGTAVFSVQTFASGQTLIITDGGSTTVTSTYVTIAPCAYAISSVV